MAFESLDETCKNVPVHFSILLLNNLSSLLCDLQVFITLSEPRSLLQTQDCYPYSSPCLNASLHPSTHLPSLVDFKLPLALRSACLNKPSATITTIQTNASIILSYSTTIFINSTKSTCDIIFNFVNYLSPLFWYSASYRALYAVCLDSVFLGEKTQQALY